MRTPVVLAVAILFSACATASMPPRRREPSDTITWGITPSSEPDWSSTDYMTWGRFSSYETAPGSWSSTGGFGLRWGMGPGDVRKQLRALEFVSPDSFVGAADRIEYQAGAFDYRVEDLPVTVWVHFRRGRLFRIVISSLVAKLPPIGTADQLGWERKESWRKSLTKTLTDKYGPPMRTPSAKALECADAKEAFCKSEEWDREQHDYVWESSGTELSLRVWYPPELVYVDQMAKAAYDAARKTVSQRAVDEARREHERL